MSGVADKKRSVGGSEAPIDGVELAAIANGDRAVEREMLAAFRRTNDLDVAALGEAVVRRDLAAITRLSHRIKGAGKIAGAKALLCVCEAIERAGRADDWGAVAMHTQALCRESDRINAYLDALDN